MEDKGKRREITRSEIETIFSTGFIAVLIGGGAGVYFPLVMGKTISADSLATYVLAVLAPFWIDMLLPEPYWPKLSKKTRMLVGVGCAIAAVLAMSALLRDGKAWDMTLAALGTVFVLVVWFFLAVLSERYIPELPMNSKAPLGGEKISPDTLEGGGLK
ncbi:MAG: hypothetical protein HY935_05740 [Nitrosomonadales bacterium]|nr:hypothetical protein [Nitrosomonadales bacterium]